MNPWARSAFFILLLDSAWSLDALNVNLARAAEASRPQDMKLTTPQCIRQEEKKPPSLKNEPPGKKTRADPNDDGGAQKELKVNAKRCARGWLVKLDRVAETIAICDQGDIIYLRLTDRTIFRVGAERGSLEDI